MLAAAFFRFFELWQYPVGFYFDEAANLFDIFGLGPNYHPIYFPNNNGREPLFFYWAAIFVRPLTVSPYALRVAAAFLGVATIPAVYFCVSQVLRKAERSIVARRTALLSAAVCAVLFVHVLFSRTGLRTISLPLFACLAFGLLWQAARLRSWARFLAGGVLLGLCLYTYTAARLLAGGVAVYAVYCLLFQRRAIYWRGAAAAVTGFVLTSAPLAWYAYANSAYFFQRTETVAITDTSTVWHNTLAILAMFNIHGTDEGLQNIPGMPMFDLAMGLMFLLGVLLALRRLRSAPYVFALLWLVSIIPASALSPRAPYYLRLTGLIPPAVLFAGLGLADIRDSLARIGSRWGGRAWLTYSLPALILALTGLTTFRNYFQVWGPSSDAFYGLMQEKVDASVHLKAWVAAGDQVFLAPLYDQDWTYKFLTRGVSLQSFEAKNCTVLPPPGKSATYAYPFFDREQPPALLSHLPGSPRIEDVPNSRGEPDLLAIHLAASDVPEPPGQAVSFGGQLALLRSTFSAATVHPGDVVHITMRWRALRPPDADYTVFVHADEATSHHRIGRDSMPCGASFGTSHWTAGEQVEDYFDLAIPSDAPSGRYLFTTGLYRAADQRNLRIDGRDATDLQIGVFDVGR
jgi:4-amino-4-deoxy-L-arabinose transferase-like glycosyltransferase